MRVEFGKQSGGGSFALIDRPDRVRLRLWSYDRKFLVPHDIAHLVAERAFRITGGIWGSIEAGAMFGSMEVVSGRLRHDHRKRSDVVLRANAEQIGIAELLAGVVHQGTEQKQNDRQIGAELRQAWGAVRADPCPIPEARAVEAVRELRAIADSWRDLPVDATLTFDWLIRRQRTTRGAKR